MQFSLTCLLSILGPEIWNIEAGRMTHQGKAAVVEDAFLNSQSPKGSGTNTPARSRFHTPVTSRTGTPIPSGGEDAGQMKLPVKKKKKLTRNQMKAQEERRRLRKLQWLTTGGPKPEDTDSDIDP
jgi:elongation factor 3